MFTNILVEAAAEILGTAVIVAGVLVDVVTVAVVVNDGYPVLVPSESAVVE